ncbi:MAG: hypothetical protein WC899_04305 [bacterium]|jgi:hypothetical protein
MVEKIVLAALILLLGTGAAADPPPAAASTKPGAATAPSPAARSGKSAVRLEEIRITGSPEHPGVLFFLPRARFHMLPLQTEGDGKDPLPAKGRGKGTPAR